MQKDITVTSDLEMKIRSTSFFAAKPKLRMIDPITKTINTIHISSRLAFFFVFIEDKM